MSPPRPLARLLGVALMLGGLATAMAFAPAAAVVEASAGGAEIAPEVEEEKTLPPASAPAVLDAVRAEVLVAHAAPRRVPRGAPPTPPPRA